MLIKDLEKPVTSSKADWLAGTDWLGFTPTDDSLLAKERCRATIARQFANGYVIEYVTESFGVPNSGYENDSGLFRDREAHSARAGRFVAVHRLRSSAKPLIDIIGSQEFERVQDMWAKGNERHRWSVAFPIVETYRIINHPKAKDVLGEESYQRLYKHPSAILRLLNEAERNAISELEIERVEAPNEWSGIEEDFASANLSEIDLQTRKRIGDDLSRDAPEGMASERWNNFRSRAMWLANKFILERRKINSLKCDDCDFNPATRADLSAFKPRSLLDVHHKNPLAEGVRRTTLSDFALLCPTCHRITHAKMTLS